jgi:hypothetical protein
MKAIRKYSNCYGLVLALCVMVISGCSCSAPKPTPPTPDPLTEFHVADLRNLNSNKAITDDYKSYIQTLSPEEQQQAGLMFYYEDGTGQHAVEFRIGINHKVWRHLLIYDKDNKRINTLKYVIGDYHSWNMKKNTGLASIWRTALIVRLGFGKGAFSIRPSEPQPVKLRHDTRRYFTGSGRKDGQDRAGGRE